MPTIIPPLTSFPKLNQLISSPEEIDLVSRGLITLHGIISNIQSGGSRDADKNSMLHLLWVLAYYGESEDRRNALVISYSNYRAKVPGAFGETRLHKACNLFSTNLVKAVYSDEEDYPEISITFNPTDRFEKVADAAYYFAHQLINNSSNRDVAFINFKKADMRCFV